eukprot:1009616_1
MCEETQNTGCPDTWEDASYCCNYVLNNPENSSDQLSQQGLFLAITLVRDLNIASLLSDYAFVIVGICTFLAISQTSDGDYDKARRITLGLTALGSLVDVCLTFTIVALINENHLVGIDDLYENDCYSDSSARTILDLENQFQTVLILDVVEGVLDIISLIVLACGTYIRSNNEDSDIATCSEGIHAFMFMVFDVIIISVNVFVFVLPSYDKFESSYADETQICFRNNGITSTTTSTLYPEMETTIDHTEDGFWLASYITFLAAVLCGGLVILAGIIGVLCNGGNRAAHATLFALLVACNVVNIVIVPFAMISALQSPDECTIHYVAAFCGTLSIFVMEVFYCVYYCALWRDKDYERGVTSMLFCMAFVSIACSIIGFVAYSTHTDECRETTSGRCLIARS